jgi:hypothetical protein
MPNSIIADFDLAMLACAKRLINAEMIPQPTWVRVRRNFYQLATPGPDLDFYPVLQCANSLLPAKADDAIQAMPKKDTGPAK